MKITEYLPLEMASGKIPFMYYYWACMLQSSVVIVWCRAVPFVIIDVENRDAEKSSLEKPNANVLQKLFENAFFKTLLNEQTTPKHRGFLLCVKHSQGFCSVLTGSTWNILFYLEKREKWFYCCTISCFPWKWNRWQSFWFDCEQLHFVLSLCMCNLFKISQSATGCCSFLFSLPSSLNSHFSS